MFSLRYASHVLGHEPDPNQHPYVLAIWDPADPITPALPQRRFLLIDQPRLRLGRDPLCEVRIANPYVSRIHGILTRVTMGTGDYYWIEDGDGSGKSSANGVLFGGKKIDQSQQVLDGDQFGLGKQVSISLHEIRPTTANDYEQHERLGDLLEEAGLISAQQLKAALHQQHQEGLLLGEVLLHQQWLHWQTLEFFIQHFFRSQSVTRKHLIGEYLKAAGLVTQEQLVEALRIHRRQQVYFGFALVQQGYLKPDTLNFFLHQAGISTT